MSPTGRRVARRPLRPAPLRVPVSFKQAMATSTTRRPSLGGGDAGEKARGSDYGRPCPPSSPSSAICRASQSGHIPWVNRVSLWAAM
jgi:hypothetical protein